MIIRQATDQDWDQIYPFFRDIVAAGQSYVYPENLSSEEAKQLWMGQGRTVVAVDGETVLGSAIMGANRAGRGDHLATGSFMVDPQHSGRGVGRALGEHVVQWARDSGFRGIQFNAVVESNTVAVRLWTSLGFEVIGTVPAAFRHPELGYVGLHVMYLALSD
ncbi:GNAT family N-acetyltransferase [Psychromicrobium lacuslunae]|uniref:GCN5 family acetyltransferase n=1 Tax=Psychromicrobium lacuslunae TaxID=1618207 RepID=A0A0D4BWB3_9MICC|nr:GNAT family N-acetyltransferase [Psychromicrobium lacuslunae]AJT40593.1 GCN5 family acetyltransferase [Psychromicrobium lacuslunae]